MKTMKFAKELLLEILYNAAEGFGLIGNEIIDTSRWSIQYKLIFEQLDTGKFYHTYYQVGATECQDESPFEFEDDMIECVEVEPVEVTVIQYKVVN